MSLQSTADEKLMIESWLRYHYQSRRSVIADSESGVNRTVIDILEILDLGRDGEWLDIFEVWINTERAEWALSRAKKPPDVVINEDVLMYSKRYAIMADLSDRALTEWILKFK